MAKEYLDKDGLLYLWQKIKDMFAIKNHASTEITYGVGGETTYGHLKLSDSTNQTAAGVGVGIAATPKAVADALTEAKEYFDDNVEFYNDATTTTHGLMSASDKTKLNGITTGAEVNQNAFSNVVVGSTTIAADGKTDTLTLVAGSGVTLTPDATNDKITITATGYSNFVGSTTSSNGTHGLVPAPSKDYDYGWVLTARGTWNDIGGVLESGASGDSTGYLFLGGSDGDELIVKSGNSANSVAVLDSSGKIPTSLLPSYVDDVIEVYARSGQTALSSTWLSATSGGSALTPETGKIYVLMADSGDYAANSQFRWSGTAYVKLADGGVSSITNAEIDTIIAS